MYVYVIGTTAEVLIAAYSHQVLGSVYCCHLNYVFEVDDLTCGNAPWLVVFLKLTCMYRETVVELIKVLLMTSLVVR